MDTEQLAGLQRASAILLDRLREKDYDKYFQVIMFSPKEAVEHAFAGSTPPSHYDLGCRIKALCASGRLRLAMGRDGVVRGVPMKKVA